MKTSGMIDFILCAAALVIGVWVVILAVLNKIDPLFGVMLLGVGMCCIGFSLLDAETPLKNARKKNRKKR